jgi:carboxymethylenebutenolidase
MTPALRTIEIPAPGGTAEAYLAGPDDRSSPGVLFYMDALGLRPQIQKMTERIAGWGYTVLAPNVFYRDGSVEDLAQDREGAMGRVRALTPDLARADAPAYLEALRAVSAPGGLGVTGYCMGARLAVRTATDHPGDVVAAAGFHGGGLATEDPDSPHAGIGEARAEFVFGHADHDKSMPPEAVGRLGEALAAAGLVFINDVYAGAPHGYTMADTPSYREEAAERHYRALESLLERTLRGRSPVDRTLTQPPPADESPADRVPE